METTEVEIGYPVRDRDGSVIDLSDYGIMGFTIDLDENLFTQDDAQEIYEMITRVLNAYGRRREYEFAHLEEFHAIN